MTKLTAELTAQPGTWSGSRRLLAAAVLLVVTASVYRNSIQVPFFFDDPAAITDNATIRHLWPLQDVLSPPTAATGAAGRPLVNLSLAINYAWGGLDVRGYHITNIGLHVLTALTLWGVLRRNLLSGPWPVMPLAGGASAVGRKNRRPLFSPGDMAEAKSPTGQTDGEFFAFGMALLWAVHPLLTESVVCVVQRNEIMGSLFYLLTFYAFIRSVGAADRGGRNLATVEARRNQPAPTSLLRSKQSCPAAIGWQSIAVVTCLLGVACKEIVATAPILVFLYDRTFVTGSFGAAWRQRRQFYLALASTWVLLVALMVGANQRGGTVGFGLGMSSWDYLLTQCRALTIYLKLSCWPHPLLLDYGVEVSRLGEVWGHGLGVLALLAGTIWALWRKPRLGFIGAVFFVILAPSSSFVPLTTQTIAEHRMYLPLAAVLILLVGSFWQFAGRARRAVLTALVCGAGWLTYQHINLYRNEAHLWEYVIASKPNNFRAHTALGRYFGQREQWVEALLHYTEALRLQPLYAPANYDISLVLVRLGRPAEALDYFSRIYPTYATEARFDLNYGNALIATGRLPEGVALLEASLRIQPDQPDAHSQLGLALEELGRPTEAREHYRAGLRLDPQHAWLHANLGNVLAGFRQWPEAEMEFKRALELKPDFAAVHHNLARLLTQLDRPAEAIPHHEQELKHFGDSANAHHNFSLTLAKTGRVAEAITQEEIALRLDPSLNAARAHLVELQRRQ